MDHFRIGAIAISLGLAFSPAAHAQTVPAVDQAAPATPSSAAPAAAPSPAVAPEVPAGWTLPAELISKRLSDDALKAANGSFETLLKNTPGDNGRIPGVTQSYVLTSPTGLPQVINYAVQSTTNEEASAVGLGLCTTTASLMNAANNPASPPAQGQAARDLARTILSSVAAASATSSRTNQAISTSFGVSVNANGGVAVTCKALNGEVVATTAVSPAAASSSAGLGSPVNGDSDPVATAGLNGEESGGGGAGRHISFPSAASALQFAANNIASASSIAVPGRDVGAGLLPLLALGTYIAFRYRRRSVGAVAF